jgi:predicted RNA-binding Zn ribbon-like protein
MGRSFLFRYQGRVTATRYLEEGFGQQFLFLDAINSLYRDGFGNVTDFLSDASWVRVFLKRWNLQLKSPTRSAQAELADLRTHMRQIAESRSSALIPRDLSVLNKALNAPTYQRLSLRRGALHTELRPVTADWSWVRSRIAASFVEVLIRYDHRLKMCRNAGCRWMFYDMTKGRTRLWCNDGRCGNRDRARRAREKRGGA